MKKNNWYTLKIYLENDKDYKIKKVEFLLLFLLLFF